VSTIPLIPNAKIFALVMVTLLFTVTAVVIGFAAEQKGRTPAPPLPRASFAVSVSAVRWVAPTSCFTVVNQSDGPRDLGLGASFSVATELTATHACRQFAVSGVSSASAGFEVVGSSPPLNWTDGEPNVLPFSASILLGSSAAVSGALELDLNVTSGEP
jgi:hypothetical protein